MDRQDDGVDAVGVRLGPNASSDGILSNKAGGQYYLVCDGSLRVSKGELPKHSLMHLEPGESVPTLTSGLDGAEVLILQLARATTRPGSDLSKLIGRERSAYVQRPDDLVS